LPERWESLDIRGEKPLVPIQDAGWWWIAAVIGVLALAAAGAWWMATRRRAAVLPARPACPPHERALEDLERLRQEALPSRRRFEEFYVRLSTIVRRYVEERFSVRAPEMTTEEFLQAALRASALSAEHRVALQEFLSRCDLVKFARYEPSEREADDALSSAFTFVQDTRPPVGSDPVRGQTPVFP
jgi:hypothetical protein